MSDIEQIEAYIVIITIYTSVIEIQGENEVGNLYSSNQINNLFLI